MVFYATFNSISVISRQQFTLFISYLGFTSTRLGSEVSCPRTLPRKTPEHPVWLEPRTPGLRVKHFTSEPGGMAPCRKRRTCWLPASSPFATMFSKAFLLGSLKLCVVYGQMSRFNPFSNDKS